MARALHRVAEPDDLHGTRAPRRETEHAHRVGVVEYQRLWAEALGVLENIEPDRDRAQRLEEPPGPDRVSDALVHPVLRRNIVVVADALQPAHLDAVHEVIRAPHHLPSFGRGNYLPVGLAEFGNQLLDETVHRPQTAAVNVHKGDRPAALPGNLEDVVDQPRGKTATRSHHRQLDRMA